MGTLETEQGESVRDRLPPHSPEDEIGVLGCILLDPRPSLLACSERIELEDFYDLRHRKIYTVLLAMQEKLEPIDRLTLLRRLTDSKDLGKVGGADYLNWLADQVPSAANIAYYFPVLLDRSRRRRMIRFCAENSEKAFESNGDGETLIGAFEADALKVRQERNQSRGIADIKKIQFDLTDDYEAALNGSKAIGLRTGFSDMDHTAGGMMPQEMIVLAGVPSSGKTSLAINIAFRVAETGETVGIISLETSAKKIIHRCLSALGKVAGGDFLRGKITENDMELMKGAQLRLGRLRDRLLVSDDEASTPGRLGATFRRMYQRGARLFVVDYLQLIQAEGKTNYEKTTAASKLIKGLAKELDVPVIVISSLNREVTKASRPPTMSDLRDSGQIEFDADKILLLHCKDSETHTRQVECHIAKNKDGAQGTVHFTFFASQFRFEAAAKSREETE